MTTHVAKETNVAWGALVFYIYPTAFVGLSVGVATHSVAWGCGVAVGLLIIVDLLREIKLALQDIVKKLP